MQRVRKKEEEVAIFHDWAGSCFALFVSAHDSNCLGMYFFESLDFGPGAVESRNFSWRCGHQPCDVGSQSY